MGIRVLLINAINKHVEVETRYPSLGAAYLAAFARKQLGNGFVFRVVDSNIHSAARDFMPHLVGISSVSQNFNIAKEYANYFQSLGIPVIMGGIHISFLPKTLPFNVVAGCIGEGEHSFVELLKAFADNALTPSRLNRIPGIVFWDNGEFYDTGSAVLQDNLDLLPHPARDLLPIRSHTYMFTSRGCPYRCCFCASSRFWNKLRFFSAEYVVGEIEQLVKDYKVKMISFFDDLFVADKSRIENIIALLDKRSILKKVSFTCNCRANLVNKELANMLFRLGVVSANMGFESANYEILRFLKGDTLESQDNVSAIEILKKNGIAVNGSFIIGSPMETENQAMETYNFIKKNRVDLFDIYMLTPYPGTPIWDYALERGIVSDDMPDWSILDINNYRLPKSKKIILSERISRERMIYLYNKFRRLRFRRNLLKVLTHPMIKDVPLMAFRLAKEKFYSYKNR